MSKTPEEKNEEHAWENEGNTFPEVILFPIVRWCFHQVKLSFPSSSFTISKIKTIKANEIKER